MQVHLFRGAAPPGGQVAPPSGGCTGESGVEGQNHLGLGDLVITANGPDGGTDGEELDDVAAPEVRLLDELDARRCLLRRG